MDKIRLALVGCGGMGTRHLYGLRELAQTPFNHIELCGLCDLRRENVELAAVEAEKLLGVRPRTFTNLQEMIHQLPDLHAVDIVTDPPVHHDVARQAMDAGLHVMVEKPMAITVGACQMMVEAARRNGRILSVAENFRRDPSARLVRHLLNTGAIGNPYMAMFHSLSPGNHIFITPWRHQKERSGFLLDMGVHITHMIRYQLGDIEEVYGDVRLIEPVRRKPESISDVYTFYQNRFEAMEAEIEPTAEDTSHAVFRMQSGVTVSWLVGISGHGSSGRQLILGDRGCIEGFGTRGGRMSLKQVDRESLSQEEILETFEGFELDPLTAHLFPSGVSDDDDKVDWKLIAIEYHELAEAILNGRDVEVDGTEGLKDVASLYAIFESSLAGRAVKLSEVETCQVYEYQAEIDAALGIEP